MTAAKVEYLERALRVARAERDEAKARIEALEKALSHVYHDCKRRAVNGVVPLGNSCWHLVCKAMEGKDVLVEPAADRQQEGG